MSLTMPFSAAIPACAVDLSVRLLLPLFVTLVSSQDEARTLILATISDFRPGTPQELAIATEVIGLRMKRMILLAQSADPDLAPQKADQAVRRACSLARPGEIAQRELDALRRERQAQAEAGPEEAAPIAAAATPQDKPPTPDQPVSPSFDDALPEFARADVAAQDLAHAEKSLATSERLLALMQRQAGGVPLRGEDAQQLHAQQRIVEVYREAVQQARLQPADAAFMEAATA